MPTQPPSDATTPVVPIPPTPPKFNPKDPLSITWYVTAVLTVIGFVLHKDLTNWTGPVALGVFAAVGIAQGIVQAMKQNTYNHVVQQFNGIQIDHWVNVARPVRDYALHDDVSRAFSNYHEALTTTQAEVDALRARLDVLAPEPPKPTGVPGSTG